MFWAMIVLAMLLIVSISVVAGAILSRSPRRRGRDPEDVPIIGPHDF